MLNNVREFNRNIENTIANGLRANEARYVELVQAQLQRGKDADDVLLRPYADPEYAEYKRSLNPLGVTDLRLFGSFYDAMRLDLYQDFVQLISTDTKYKKLIFGQGRFKGYGERSMDLSSANKQTYTEENIMPYCLQEFKNMTGAK